MLLLIFAAFLFELSDASLLNKKATPKETDADTKTRSMPIPIPMEITPIDPARSLIEVPMHVQDRRKADGSSRDSSNPRSSASSSGNPTHLQSSPNGMIGSSALADLLPSFNYDTWQNLIGLNPAWAREEPSAVGSASNNALMTGQSATQRSGDNSIHMEMFSYHALMNVTSEGSGLARRLDREAELTEAACKEAASALLSTFSPPGSGKSVMSPSVAQNFKHEEESASRKQEKQEHSQQPTHHHHHSHHQKATKSTETLALKKPAAADETAPTSNAGRKSPVRKAKSTAQTAKAKEQVVEEENNFNTRTVSYHDILGKIKKPRSNSDLSLNSGKDAAVPAGSTSASRAISAETTPRADTSRKASQSSMPMNYKSALTESLQMTSLGDSGKAESKLPTPAAKAAPKVPSMPFSEWSLLFRLPSSMKIPKMSANRPAYFPFSRCTTTDLTFLRQLEDFRRQLRVVSEADSKQFRFVDYVPFFDPSLPLNQQNPERIVSAPPMKIFTEPPKMEWIPIRCDLLGFEFEVIDQYKGREARAGRKSILEFVRNVGEPDDETTYVRKTYNGSEFFLNELNFFQHVDSNYIVKPICVDPMKPAIVMQHFNGRRIHEAMYETVIKKYYYYKGDVSKAWEDTVNIMARLFAKLMVAIKQIHDLGFIHCDIKPENILYHQNSGHIVLIDFDLAVSAPYIFSNRGTATTVAPETVGLLSGPVHFGVDWWGFGNTVTIIIAWALAGVFRVKGLNDLSEKHMKYVPFAYDYRKMAYVMTPIPAEFPPLIREFLYPFFSPYPAHRVFSEHDAFEYISQMPFLRKPVRDIYAYFKDDEDATNSLTRCFFKLRRGPIRLTKRPHLAYSRKEGRQMMEKFINELQERMKSGQNSSSSSRTGSEEEGTEESGEEDEEEDEDEEETEDDDTADMDNIEEEQKPARNGKI